MKRMFNLETQEWEEDNTPELDALGYLQSIYRDPGQSEARRLKAAIEALPFEKPKLAVIATASIDERVAHQLDRRISASRSAMKVIDAPPPPPTNGHQRSAEAVSAERMGKSFTSARRF